jgi:hypothetical protein
MKDAYDILAEYIAMLQGKYRPLFDAEKEQLRPEDNPWRQIMRTPRRPAPDWET